VLTAGRKAEFFITLFEELTSLHEKLRFPGYISPLHLQCKSECSEQSFKVWNKREKSQLAETFSAAAAAAYYPNSKRS
jgi:hypothetical protein